MMKDGEAVFRTTLLVLTLRPPALSAYVVGLHPARSSFQSARIRDFGRACGYGGSSTGTQLRPGELEHV